MVSHFSTIGLPIDSREEFMAYGKLAYESGERLETDDGAYLKLALGDGVELWGQVNEADEMIGLNPHFKGSAVSTVRLVEKIENPDTTVLDGQIYGEAEPDEEEDYAYPFAFDLPDMALHEIHFPVIKKVQLAAFAHELNIYANEEVYNKVQKSEDRMNMATEFFIPSGLFTDEESNSLPDSTAVFGGRVLTTRKIRNAYTNQYFYYAKVKTLGGEFDVVADPKLVTEELTEESIISGSFWLSGQIIRD